LIASIERLKATMAGPSDCPRTNTVFKGVELGHGMNSVVSCWQDPEGSFRAVKRALNLRGVELIRREAIILEKLNHPLIIHSYKHIHDPDASNPGIVMELAGNGTLADYIENGKQDIHQLCSETRTAKILVGIVLAMRFLESNGIIYRDLKPSNILLDWNWNVRISDFGHCISPDVPPISSSSGLEGIRRLPSVDFHYLAPECYDEIWTSESDVFSFGLILYEVIVGEPVFPKWESRLKIARKVLLEDWRPIIPDCVPSSVADLIYDCWASDPRDRPCFTVILHRLRRMQFQVTPNVNCAKVAAFVDEIETNENELAALPAERGFDDRLN
jgi:serine/threonine protein kinase